jgi:hypothetical protein
VKLRDKHNLENLIRAVGVEEFYRILETLPIVINRREEQAREALESCRAWYGEDQPGNSKYD